MGKIRPKRKVKVSFQQYQQDSKMPWLSMAQKRKRQKTKERVKCSREKTNGAKKPNDKDNLGNENK